MNNAVSTNVVSYDSEKESMVSVFNNTEFGSIRTVEMNNDVWFVGKDVARALGYSNPNEALQDHVYKDDKFNSKTLSSLGQRGGWLINESGLYSLILSSKLESAQKFKHWVTSEVLPSIRKTGKYEIKESERNSYQPSEYEIEQLHIRKIEADSKRAEILERLAGKYEGKSNTFRNVCYVEAANIVSGHKLLNGVETESYGNYLSATEVAIRVSEITGTKVSSQKIGILAKENNMKSKDSSFGEWRRTKSQYSNKEVDNFYYKPESVDRFVELLRK